MKKADFFNLNLNKWPGLLVVGKTVTREQAMEIIIRTDSLWFTTNDYKFAKELNGYLFDVKIEESGYGKDNDAIADKLGVDRSNSWNDVHAYRETKLAEVGQIPLNYLDNDRIVSSWIGGSKGWCNWNGKILCDNFNIGKWPSVQDVYNDWVAIAKAFPFLDLKAQLLSTEICDMDNEPEVVVQFNIKNGKVKMSETKRLLTQPKELDFSSMLNFGNPSRERGCTIEMFKEAIDYCRERNLELNERL